MKQLLSMALLLAAAVPAQAGEARMHSGELAHALDRVANTARVLYVAAHPDDENTTLLGYLANGRHVTAAYLSMTRGGGGQNLIGDEKGVLLDVIRTEELLAARRLDKAVQRFTRMKDFGYSKSAKEALATWGHDEALRDVVWTIRTFQPDVIVTRFDENPPNHGHHTASAILAREAFAAAADPARFPDQLRDGVTVWQATRLVHNLSTWRKVTIPPDALKLDLGAHDARLGMGYGELSALSRSQHKSQGFGRAGERGPIIEHFVHVAGEPAKTDLLDGVTTDWSRYGDAATPVIRALDEARRLFVRDEPQQAVRALLTAREALARWPQDPRVRDAQTALEQVAVQAAGLFVRATSPSPVGVARAQAKVFVEIVPGRVGGLVVKQVSAGDAVSVVDATLARNEKKVVAIDVPVPAKAAVSSPSWLSKPTSAGRFDVSDPQLVGRPLDPPALTVTVDLEIAGRPLTLTAPVVHAWTDRVHGERVRPFLVVPTATVTPAREAVMLPNAGRAPLVLRVKAGRDSVVASLSPGLPAGWRAEPAAHPISLAKAGDEVTVRFDVTPPKDAAAVEVRPVLTVDGRDEPLTWREDVIDYPHIPYQLVLQPSRVKLVPVSLKVPAGLIGYVQGSGDSIAEDLAHVGARVQLIDDATLRGGDLSKYAAIVVGIRAYNTREALKANHARLMRYVESGGRVVVQYATVSRWEPMTQPMGPFPLELGNGRITDETATMTPVDPKHRLLASPHRLSESDYEGWVQERGIYFASTWDDRYQPLFSMNDPDESPLLGGALVARHGKGRYVYTGLAFFRQLPAGVPGAYRLLLNLLAAD